MILRSKDKNKENGEAGYTLLELLVVLAILALILSIATPMVMKQFGKAKSDTARVQVSALATNLEFFFMDVGRYPTVDEGLDALITKPTSAAGWNGPYVARASSLKDPWGAPYGFKRMQGEARSFEIYSLGADAKTGGEGEDRDVSSLE